MPTTDIRLDVEFFNHPKTVKLRHRLGVEAIISLQKLWMWAAKNRPEGTLANLDIEDIEIAGEWEGKPGAFHSTLVTLRWLDVTEEDGREIYRLHDWADHNEWVADAVNRGDRARFARMAAAYPGLYTQLAQQGRDSITREEYLALTKKTGAPIQAADATSTGVNVPSTPPPPPPPPPAPSPVPFVDDPNKQKQERMEQWQQGALEQQAKRTAELLPRFGNYSPRPDDVPWIVCLCQKYSNLGIDIHKEIINALKWRNKKDFEVKNLRAFITDWLERLQGKRMQKG